MPGLVMVCNRWVEVGDALTVLDHPGHSDQKSHGRKGSGVREALARAGTIDQLNASAMAEAKRITGRDIPVDMTGADLQMAKEHLEGIMQGLDRFPAATLTGVYSYGPGAAKTNMGAEITRLHRDASAVTQAHGVVEGGRFIVRSSVYFNTKYADDPDGYQAMREAAHAEGYLVTRTPTGTALHEFGHVVTNQTGTKRAAYDSAVESAEAAGATPRSFITRNVSSYAASDMGEFAAEAFADVMLNGDGASDVSKGAFKVIEDAYASPSNRADRYRVLNHPGHPDQRSHGRKRAGSADGGVRGALSGHDNAEAVGAAAAKEAKRITGRDIAFELGGSDPQIAAEHCEGILRGLEKYPDAPLQRVRQGGDRFIESFDAWAVTEGGTITFTNSGQAGGPDVYRQRLTQFHESGEGVPFSPMGVALHEFGHVLFNPGAAGYAGEVQAEKRAAKAGKSVKDHVREHVSGYATSSAEELGAEAFADVMLNGRRASKLSKEIVDIEVYATQPW